MWVDKSGSCLKRRYGRESLGFRNTNRWIILDRVLTRYIGKRANCMQLSFNVDVPVNLF